MEKQYAYTHALTHLCYYACTSGICRVDTLYINGMLHKADMEVDTQYTANILLVLLPLTLLQTIHKQLRDLTLAISGLSASKVSIMLCSTNNKHHT